MLFAQSNRLSGSYSVYRKDLNVDGIRGRLWRLEVKQVYKVLGGAVPSKSAVLSENIRTRRFGATIVRNGQ